MTYATNLLKDNLKNDVMIIMKPRRRLTPWTLDSGSVYKSSCAFNVIAVERNGTALTEGSSTALSAGQWYYDFDNQMLYVRKSDSTAPGSSDWIVATVEIFVSTHERIWYRIPDSSSARSVQFFGVVKTPPAIRKTRAQQILGFYPVETTGLTCVNDPNLFQDIIWDGSFNDAEIVVYHVAGEESVSNIAKVLTGKMGNFTFSDSEISFTIYDGSITLDEEFSPIGGTKYYPNGTAGIDPEFAGKPIRTFFGQVFGVRPVNIDYNAAAPSTSNNRVWALCSGDISGYAKDFPVTAINTLSTPEISVANAQYMESGDVVWIEDTADGSDSYGHQVTNVNYSTGRLTISPAGSGANLNLNSVIRKSPWDIALLKNGNDHHRLVYGRDFTLTNAAYGTIAFVLTSTCEANLGVATIDPVADKFYVTMAGRIANLTLGGSPFGAYATHKTFYTNGIMALYDIVKTYFGLTESEIDTASFTSAYASVTATVGFGVPYLGQDRFPTYKELISDLLSSLLLSAQFDENGKFSIKPLAKITTADESINSDDIKVGSWQYEMNYQESGGVKYIGRNQEYVFHFGSNTLYTYEDYLGEDVTQSNAAQYLHKTRTYQTFYSLSADGITDKLLSIFAERIGRVRVELNGQFFENEINDSVQVTRAKMPGFAYDPDTLRSRNFRIVEIQKELGKVVVVLDDQKGIDDSGVW